MLLSDNCLQADATGRVVGVTDGVDTSVDGLDKVALSTDDAFV